MVGVLLIVAFNKHLPIPSCLKEIDQQMLIAFYQGEPRDWWAVEK